MGRFGLKFAVELAFAATLVVACTAACDFLSMGARSKTRS
jgi:hypothetical protein